MPDSVVSRASPLSSSAIRWTVKPWSILLTRTYSIKLRFFIIFKVNLREIRFFKNISYHLSMTKKVHMFMNTSTAFKYETGGRDWREMACWTNGEYQDLTNMFFKKINFTWVKMVRSEVTPSMIRSVMAVGLIQNANL